MSRAQRLLDLIQILRRYRYPVSGKHLASELDISLRTLYRDIATLQAQGASIEGEAGVGYVLRPGFMLPPLMFSEEASPTFHSFTLSNGMSLALKAKHSVMPPTEAKSGHGELAFTLDSNQKVDELFATWQAKKIDILLPPTQVPFGYTFVALDPDGHRLRVASIGKA